MDTKQKNRSGFTLFELLAVIGILVILALVVFYFLNPAQLLKQGQDGNRVEALSSLDKGISLYYSDALSAPATLYMGSSSVVYVSVPDPTATSTAGTNCAGIGLVSSNITYHCASPSTYLKNDGTGWVPINFTSYSAGTLLPTLPIDPVNTTSSGEYYVYITNGTQYEIMADPASAKNVGNTADFIKGSDISLLTSFPGSVITYTTSTYASLASAASVAFDSHTNTIWATGSNELEILDDTTHASTTIAIGNEPGNLVFDPHTNTVWVTTINGVVQVNDITYATSTYIPAIASWRLAFDSHTNTIWVANENDGDVTKIDDTTYASTTYTTEASTTYPDGIAFDSNTNTIWVANSDHNVTEINDTTIAKTYHDVGTQSYGVVFDPHTNTVWVTGDGTMTGINDTTYTTTTVSSTEIEGSAFDPHTNSIWVNGYGINTLVQVDDTTHATTVYANPGFNIGGIAFDSHTNTIWTANHIGILTEFTPSK